MTQHIDPRELIDLAELAARGGLGRGIALTDYVAEAPDQLMYIAGDELVLLRDLGEVLLASCEGVVGWMRKEDVRFDSLASTSRKPSLDQHRANGLPRTILTAPSPPTSPVELSDAPGPLDLRRISGPFELESPQQSPGIEKEGQQFFVHQRERPEPLRKEPEIDKRISLASVASSEVFGEIGGFMMSDETFEGANNSIDDMGKLAGPGAFHLTGTFLLTVLGDDHPDSAPVVTPNATHFSPSSPVVASHDDPPRNVSNDPSSDADEGFNPYRIHARETVHSTARQDQKASDRGSVQTNRTSTSSIGVGAVHAARIVLDTRPKGEAGALRLDLIPATGLPRRTSSRPESPGIPISAGSHTVEGHFAGRSVATELRLKIQRDRERDMPQVEFIVAPLPVAEAVQVEYEEGVGDEEIPSTEEQQPEVAPVHADSVAEAEAGEESRMSSEESHQADQSSTEGTQESAMSTLIETPHPPSEVTFTAPSPPSIHEALLASPLPFDETEAKLPVAPMSPPSLVPPPPPTHSPGLSPNGPSIAWSPGSPSSPHSIAATQQAVEASRQTPEGKRPRGLTLVGRMEADLKAAKGPVPITFLVGGPEMSKSSIGLGLPSAMGRITPELRRATTPTPVEPPMPDDIHTNRLSSSRFPPAPIRSVTSPGPIPHTGAPAAPGPKPGFFPARPRSRSFSAAAARAFGKAQKENTPLSPINTSAIPPIPTTTTPQSSKRSFFAKPGPPTPGSPAYSTLSRSSTTTSVVAQHPPSSYTLNTNDSNPSLPLQSPRSSSFSFSSKSLKTPRKASRALPSPVSHRDFEDTVQADGMDFEIIKPTLEARVDDRRTIASGSSSGSLRAPLPETDEWGFLKEKSPTPEIFQSRSAPGDHRVSEQKWLAIISSPMPSGGPPKKVRKLVLEAGIPSSLRGKVWAWFLAPSMSARVPGLFNELLGHDMGASDARLDEDVACAWADHSIFAEPTSPGRADFRNLLRAYSAFAPSGYTPPMAQVAGALLVHCVAEDAFWLLSGLVNGVLKDYWVKERSVMLVDSAVFQGVLSGSEKELAGLFKGIGLNPVDFLERWYTRLFIRSLPWPTALRVIDGVVAEGPRFLLIASLTILTLSRDRLLALSRAREPVLSYLRDLPQDSLLLPETFMRACERVKFRDEDWQKLRGSVEKEMGLI